MLLICFITGCYGVSDVESFSSADSLSQSAPWFCEVCSAGVEDPDCELCPNKGGIFKETDVGKWVHLVCALYVPGVAFGEVIFFFFFLFILNLNLKRYIKL